MMLSSLLFLVLSAPPSIKVEKAQTIVIHNGVTIVLLADGSIKLNGPTIDLSFPADENAEVLPVVPPNVVPEVVSPFQKFYDADKTPLVQKKLALTSLSQIWETALKDLPEAKTTGAFHDNLKTMGKPLGNTLIDLRKEISKDFVKIVSDDVPMTPELQSQLKVAIQSVLVNLKGVK
jgi:hypothetical protein